MTLDRSQAPSEFDEERHDFDDGGEHHDDNQERQEQDDAAVDEVHRVQGGGGGGGVVVVQVQHARPLDTPWRVQELHVHVGLVEHKRCMGEGVAQISQRIHHTRWVHQMNGERGGGGGKQFRAGFAGGATTAVVRTIRV